LFAHKFPGTINYNRIKEKPTQEWEYI